MFVNFEIGTTKLSCYSYIICIAQILTRYGFERTNFQFAMSTGYYLQFGLVAKSPTFSLPFLFVKVYKKSENTVDTFSGSTTV